MELLNALLLIALFFLGLILLAWIGFQRLRALLQQRPDDPSWLLMQQQMDQLRSQLGQALDASTQLTQQQLGQILGHVNERLKENAEVMQKTQQSLGERLDNAARVVGNVQKSLGGLEEANRKIYDVGKDIASLHEILRAPKLRGGFGEFLLEQLLAQILPADHYSVQHCFRSGEKVDAVIKLGSSLVPIDAKFPLENFRRMFEAPSEEEKARAKRQFAADVRRHVDAIAAKYILPDEGTYDFALMYVPAENVYYETIIKDETAGEKNLSQYALGKRVIPVSPNCFYAYLQAIVLGLKGMKIEAQAQEILHALGRLQGDFAKFRDEFDLLGKHVAHAHASFQTAEKRLEQFNDKLISVEDGSPKRPLEPGPNGRDGGA